ncbi:hypothetical protein [Leucobacter coleopterorum]|uniref:hypothetical protein n=1 Tax=Leucobacter coleopterorum TaxID=2714933 RepID=UPI001FCA4DBA|nr:hypothetical protein [Leucobacter coleopterorum]
MTGIHLRFGTPIWIGRTGVELSVLLVGWLLGGNVGFGTLAFALLIGPLCGITLPLFDRRWRNDPKGHSTMQQSDEGQSRDPDSATTSSGILL